jgi:hypothetical protein
MLRIPLLKFCMVHWKHFNISFLSLPPPHRTAPYIHTYKQSVRSVWMEESAETFESHWSDCADLCSGQGDQMSLWKKVAQRVALRVFMSRIITNFSVKKKPKIGCLYVPIWNNCSKYTIANFENSPNPVTLVLACQLASNFRQEEWSYTVAPLSQKGKTIVSGWRLAQ